MLDRGGNSFEIDDRAFAGVKIENLAQRNVQRTDAAAYRSGERALDGHAEIANRVDSIVRQPLRKSVECFFAGEDFVPRNFALAAIGVLDCSVENPARSFPNVATSAVSFDERNDRIVRDLQFAAAVIDGRSVFWNRLSVVAALHLTRPPEQFRKITIE